MLLHQELSEKIIQGFYNVYNELGYGFLEKVYEKALHIELQNLGLECKAQKPISVYYDGNQVGKYFADLIINNKIIIEIKACALIDEHEYQLLNYLKATDIEVGLLLGFGKEAKFKRKIFTNDHKDDHL